MYSVYQHWDPLKVCIVGRSYPPEFYSWITVPHVRSLFEKIAEETEEDYQNIINKLREFGVKILRPDIPKNYFFQGRYRAPPMTPRDHTVMIGETFYTSNGNTNELFKNFYNNVKDQSWPSCNSIEDFYQLPQVIQEECKNLHNIGQFTTDPYNKIINFVRQQSNEVKKSNRFVNGSMVARIGKDLYFGTEAYSDDQEYIKTVMDKEFSSYRNHVINTGGHTDGTYCPVAPGLIISLKDVATYATSFPGWEVVYLPNQCWEKVAPFLELKKKNRGKWWIPGFEKDQLVIDVVETWLGHWTGYVEETVFDVNMLIIDPRNVMVFGYNKQVFDALSRYGITPHIVPFRHRYFWDGGIHCVTSDLHREGTMKNYFPQRG